MQENPNSTSFRQSLRSSNSRPPLSMFRGHALSQAIRYPPRNPLFRTCKSGSGRIRVEVVTSHIDRAFTGLGRTAAVLPNLCRDPQMVVNAAIVRRLRRVRRQKNLAVDMWILCGVLSILTNKKVLFAVKITGEPKKKTRTLERNDSRKQTNSIMQLPQQ
jgi:hypothetical protein